MKRQDVEEQRNVSDNEQAKISYDAATVLLFRLRAQYAHDNPEKSPYPSRYQSYSFGYMVNEKKRFGNHSVQQRRINNRDPKRVANIFRDIVQSRGWESPLAVGSVTARWKDFVGKNNAAHSCVENFTGSKVIVRCDSTVWANSLRTMKKNIIEIFDREVGKNVVTDIEILGPKGVPNWGRGAWSAHGRGPRDTYG